MSALKRKRGNSVKKEQPSPPPPREPMYSHSPLTTMKSWYGNASYSDLTILLADDRKIPVHKIVLCSRNEYFDVWVGLGSPATHQKRKTIKLLDDDPDAVRAVIRSIYGWSIREIEDDDDDDDDDGDYNADDEDGNDDQLDYDIIPRPPHWHYLLNILKAADKFQQHYLAAEAESRLHSYAFQLSPPLPGHIQGEIDEVVMMLYGMHEVEHRPETMDVILQVALLIQQRARSNVQFHAYLVHHPGIAVELLEKAPLKC